MIILAIAAGVLAFVFAYSVGTWLLWNTPLHKWLGM